MCGGVFFWEGILKFVYTNQGIGRFTKLGIPMPGATADFVAVLEIVGGLMLLAGLGTRLISIPFVIEMLVAICNDQNQLVPGDFAAAAATGAADLRFLGRAARNPLRIRAIADCAILVYCGPRTLVARCVAGPAPREENSSRERRETFSPQRRSRTQARKIDSVRLPLVRRCSHSRRTER